MTVNICYIVTCMTIWIILQSAEVLGKSVDTATKCLMVDGECITEDEYRKIQDTVEDNIFNDPKEQTPQNKVYDDLLKLLQESAIESDEEETENIASASENGAGSEASDTSYTAVTSENDAGSEANDTSYTAVTSKNDVVSDVEDTGKTTVTTESDVGNDEEDTDDNGESLSTKSAGEAHEGLKVFKILGKGRRAKQRAREKKEERLDPHQFDDEEIIQLKEEECDFYNEQMEKAAEYNMDGSRVPRVEGCQRQPYTKNRHQLAHGGRVKRLAVTGAGTWDKAIIPFVFDIPNPSVDDIMGRIRAHNHYHYWTCVRLVIHTNLTKSAYSLSHDNYLIHVIGNGIPKVMHVLDRLHKDYVLVPAEKAGSNIVFVCKAYYYNCILNELDNVCVHELGHAIGLAHEQKNPLRDDYLAANLQNVAEQYQWNYVERNLHLSRTFGYYDLSSEMHYKFYGSGPVGSNNYPAMRVFDPDMGYLIKNSDPYQYLHFYESSTVSGCTQLKCEGFTMPCQNYGYQAYVRDKCTCRCPEGFDPAFGCTTKYEGDRMEAHRWPASGFSTLATEIGCPQGFRPGTMTQHHVKTAMSRESSNPGADLITENFFTTYQFCTKLETGDTGMSLEWPAGRYCIFRHGGLCPSGFQEGYIQYADTSAPTNIDGILPDGIYTDDTRFYFCCRSDGTTSELVHLPSETPFILFRQDRNCQKVLGTQVVKGWFRIKNEDVTKIEKSGSLPKIGVHYQVNYQLHYCYYTPDGFSEALAYSEWPVDPFSMFQTKDGNCPKGFETGTWRQNYEDGGLSDPIFANINMTSDETRKIIDHKFCTKPLTAASGIQTTWGPGQYCIFKSVYGNCSSEFMEGSISFPDKYSPDVDGPVPDGSHSIYTTWKFCCRMDGFARNPLVLPNKKPFILFQQEKDKCQHILDMSFDEEFVNFKSPNPLMASGYTPYFRKYYKNTYLYFCYYYPTDYSCGDIIHLTENQKTSVIESPGYPNEYPAGKMCQWNIIGPENSKIILEFQSFSLEANDGTCDDYLEIRHTLPGQMGISYCGDENLNRTIISQKNILGLTFKSDLARNRKGFRAIVNLLKPDDLCYSGKGELYRGTVNRTNHFKACLPWSQVKNCPHNTYAQKDLDDGLVSNYCRNPGDGTAPWCYTEATTCERQYCDVCGLEKSYDIFEECSTALYQNCDDTETQRGCCKSCGACDEPIPDSPTNCGPPDVPTHSIPISIKNMYTPGEKVEFVCDRNDFQRQFHTCLRDGSWSGSRFVCGRCPHGWVPFRESCYKWFDGDFTRTNATEKCWSQNAIIASAEDEEQNKLVNSVVENGEYFWIGINNGIWADGNMPVSWTNYKSGSSKAYAYSRSNDGKWIGVGSEAIAFVGVVCSYTPQSRPLCADATPDCPRYLESDATACLNRDFEWHLCPKTCGYCHSDAFCSDPGTPINSELTTGQVYEYRCKNGYSRASGDIYRTCVERQWTGEPIVCLPSDQVEERNNDVELIPRRDTLANARSYTGNNEAMRIPKNGTVVAWEFYSDISGDVSMQVWRPTDNSNEFSFIGRNRLNHTLDERIRKIYIKPSQQIQVQAGDLIGVYVMKAGIPFTDCKMDQPEDTYGNMKERADSQDGNWTVFEGYTFLNRAKPCMIISVTAIVK